MDGTSLLCRDSPILSHKYKDKRAYKEESEKFKIRENGGWGGIRTHDGLSPMPVFKTGAFNRSATHPRWQSFITG